MSTTAASPGLDSISKGRCCRQQPVAIPACSACRTQHEPQSACQPPVSRSLPGAPHSTELNRVVENVDQSCRWGRHLEAKSVQKFPDLVKNGTGRFRRGLVRRCLGYSFHYFSLGPGRSCQALADRYGVSKRAVTALAKRENWQARLAEVELLVPVRTRVILPISRASGRRVAASPMKPSQSDSSGSLIESSCGTPPGLNGQQLDWESRNERAKTST